MKTGTRKAEQSTQHHIAPSANAIAAIMFEYFILHL